MTGRSVIWAAALLTAGLCQTLLGDKHPIKPLDMSPPKQKPPAGSGDNQPYYAPDEPSKTEWTAPPGSLQPAEKKPAKPQTDPAAGLEPFNDLKGKIEIETDSAHSRFILRAAARVSAFSPSVQISLKKTDDGQSYSRMDKGLCDIVFSSVPVNPAEISNFSSAPLAAAAVVFAVNRANPVSDLTAEELRKIYERKTARWRKDDEGSFILLFGRDRDTLEEDTVRQTLLKDGYMSKKTLFVDSDDEAGIVVASDPSAICFMNLLGAGDRGVKILSAGGVFPDEKSVISGAYPFSVKYYLATQEKPSELSSLFVRYLRSPAGHELMRASGMIPLKNNE